MTLKSRLAFAFLFFALCLSVTPAAAQAPKFAVIDVQRIITDSEPGKAAREELRQFGEGREAQLQALRDEIDQLQSRISEGQMSLAQERLDALKEELEKKSIELRRATDDAGRDFNQRQERALQRIEGKVMPIIKQVGEENGYTLIFRKFESGLVYADEAVDITAEIIDRLNAAESASSSSGDSGS
jgi:outer membrane protein